MSHGIDDPRAADALGIDLVQLRVPLLFPNDLEEHLLGLWVDLDFLDGPGRRPHAVLDMRPLKGRPRGTRRRDEFLPIS